MCIGWNLKNPLFQDKRVRQALTYGVNRQEIIDVFSYGLGSRAVTPVLFNSWAFNEELKPYPYDLAKAEELLAEAGWKKDANGDLRNEQGELFEFTLKTAKDKYYEEINVFVQSQYKKLGIKVNIVMLEWNTFVEQIESHDFDAMALSWRLGFTVNPKGIWHSEADTTYNNISYSNPEVDSLIDTGRRTLDKQKAKKIWDRFQAILYDEQPYTFMTVGKSVNAFNKRIKDAEPDIRSVYQNMEDWWIPQEERVRN